MADGLGNSLGQPIAKPTYGLRKYLVLPAFEQIKKLGLEQSLRHRGSTTMSILP
jgi:hypothetical protein